MNKFLMTVYLSVLAIICPQISAASHNDENPLNSFFKSGINKFSTLAYNNGSSSISWDNQDPEFLEELQPYELIYNQTGYIYSKSSPTSKIGNPLYYENMSIGYNIYKPENPKGIFVEGYGGGGTPFSPNEDDLSNFHRGLINRGFIVIRLNFVDRSFSHSLKLGRTPQQLMRKNTFDSVQYSLHTFGQTIRYQPDSLHLSLAGIEELPMGFFGHSFGGLVSIAQSQLFEDETPFDIFISCNGGVSGDMPGWVEQRRRTYHLNSVGLEEEIQKIRRPILFMTTKTDSNVNPETTTKWIRKAHDILYVNRVPLDVCYINNVNPGKVKGEGHFIPKTGSALEECIEKVSNFILKPPQDLDVLYAQTDLITYKQKLLANKLLRHSSTQEIFLSEAFKRCVQYSETFAYDSFDEDWENSYEPLFNVIYLFEEMIRAKDRNFLDKMDKSEIDYQPLKNLFEDFLWDENKKPRTLLEFCLFSVRKTARSDEAIEKTLLSNLPLYLSFIQSDELDFEDESLNDDLFIRSFIIPQVSSTFWSAITFSGNISYRARYSLALSYFMDNPELLEKIEPYTDKFWWNLQNESLRQSVSHIIKRQQNEEFQAKESAKIDLQKMIRKYHKKYVSLQSFQL